ncbi:protein mab-21-like 3 isoform X2 [Rhinatrema bivittatum]|uniref:protein mab-21-like 3 isoform X2 n=1 Tax=Rhinatrema bivittatum TaxID=194408 RepID=UPI00112EB387|nr:protein mab-21-like 3 isoform X2 [Rhinatrema bivittatum]
MKDFTEASLDHNLQSKMELRHHLVSKVVEEVQMVIQQLTTEVSTKDMRFQPISNSGMYNKNIKVLAPAQLLITVPLYGLAGYKQRRKRRWRYYTLSGARLLSPVVGPEKLHQWLEMEQFLKSSRQWCEPDVNVEGDIVPAKVLGLFRVLLEKSITSCNLSDKVSMMETFGPGVKVTMETAQLQVEVELVPTVEIHTCWSKKARWPRFLKRWPSKEKSQCIKSFGFDLMARSNYHWQLSFLRAERVLLEGIDDDGGCRTKCFRVMRQMTEDCWCTGSRPAITSYHIQTLLLWACEKYPRSKDWRNFGKCFLRLVKKLHKCVSQHFLKHYFVKGANLLKYANPNELDIMAQKLADFLQNPAHVSP